MKTYYMYINMLVQYVIAMKQNLIQIRRSEKNIGPNLQSRTCKTRYEQTESNADSHQSLHLQTDVASIELEAKGC